VRNRFKSVFHWKFTNWVIGICGGAALTTALAAEFDLAYLFLFVAAFYSIGCWLTSDTLAMKFRPKSSKLYGADGKLLPVLSNRPLGWLLAPTIAILVLFGSFGFWIRGLQDDKELESLSGWLYPAGEHVNIQCPLAHPDDLILMIGTNAFIADKFPHTVIAINCDNILSVERDANGRIGVTLAILDKDGKVVVSVDHGQFTVNKNNFFRINRYHSKSTISVIDQSNQEVLYLHLANRNLLQLRARFNYRGVPIHIDDLHAFGTSNGITVGNCTGYTYGADVQLGECLVR
jgi:hypothetical protein